MKKEQSEKLFEKAKTAYEALTETVQMPPEKLFCNENELQEALLKKQIVETGGNAYFANETFEFRSPS